MQLKNANHVRYDQSDCTRSPGDEVKESGVYEICHADEPKATALLLRNTFFPYCRQCGDLVRYKLIHSAPHISEDPDFTEGSADSDDATARRNCPKSDGELPQRA